MFSMSILLDSTRSCSSRFNVWNACSWRGGYFRCSNGGCRFSRSLHSFDFIDCTEIAADATGRNVALKESLKDAPSSCAPVNAFNAAFPTLRAMGTTLLQIPRKISPIPWPLWYRGNPLKTGMEPPDWFLKNEIYAVVLASGIAILRLIFDKKDWTNHVVS